MGYLLNDNDIGVDHLGEFTFADALAESIHQVDTPITIGIFARWGGGKSFLLRHLESILKRYQRQDSVDDAKRERYSDRRRCKASNIRKAILWTVAILLLFFVLIFTLILAIQPAVLVVWFSGTGQEYLDNATTSPSYNATSPAPEEPGPKRPEYLGVLKIVGLVLIPFEIAAVFIVGCCGNTWLSLNYYGSFRLITYGAFTKLPTRNKHDDIVEDPGQHPADVLKYIRPGDERLAIAASESVLLPRRYIFVDFKAWEYAGSDTLWAGIVTKLSDAIESEFGVITARLFRVINVQEIPKERLDVSDRTLYAKFSYKSEENEIRDMMRQYGVVTFCEHYSAVVEEEGFEYWKVTYSNEGEFRSAKDCLKIEGVVLQTYPPGKEKKEESKSPKFHRGGPVRGSGRPLIGEPIEMKPINQPKRNGGGEDEVLNKFKHPPKTKGCKRFCAHFIRYPIKTVCLPRLVWWILILFSCVVIPIIIYAIAAYLNLDVFRTYRAVPVAGQVLLWLPASSAVTVVASRFLWAMFHSQRRRINQALDGTKTKMADELGFMDKIKTEIAVITKLIHCARFTHQQDFKVIITIDDLDRVPQEKVKAVLEAVSILLSDKSSPFVCIVAVDPRIVVKCIEEGMGSALIKANVTGHEYLKKIINLPICLPEVGNPGKRRFIAGLIDQADHSVTYRVKEGKSKVPEQQREENNFTSIDAVDAAGEVNTVDGSSDDEPDSATFGFSNDMVTDACVDFPESFNRRSEPIRPNKPRPSIRHEKKNDPHKKAAVELDDKEFLFECRKFVYEDEEMHKHLVGNPRNIKRIFNTISLTACIINCFVKKQRRRQFIHSRTSSNRRGEAPQVSSNNRKVETVVRTERLAKDLVRWIILADQWPYRTSYILQVIEDADQRETAGIEGENIPNDWTILEIFQNKVSSEFKSADRSLLGLDADPDVFYSYLRLLGKCGFTKERIVEMEKHTVNLDYSIRHSIAFDRDLSCMNAPVSKEKNGDAESNPSSVARPLGGDRKDENHLQPSQNAHSREETEARSAPAPNHLPATEKLTSV